MFPRMRALLIVWLLAGCASRSKEAPAPASTTVASSLPSNTAPRAPSTPEAGKQAAPVAPAPTSGGAPAGPASPGGPMTAAEAAAAAHAAADGTSDDSTCASDDDCSFTAFSPSGCCPTLCTPRPVTKKAASALQDQCAGAGCPLPACAPPRFATVPACEKNRCVSRVVTPQ
jgi:hypothetical protein